MRLDNGADSAVYLRSSDNDIIEVSHAAARQSNFIADYLDTLTEQCGGNEESGSNSIPEPIEIPRSSTAALKKLVEFLEHCKNRPMAPIIEPDVAPIQNTFELTVPDLWYRNYVESMSPELFWQVRMLSNFMVVEQLNVLLNVWLTFRIVGCSSDRIGEILHIPPMTDEQFRHARESQSWLFEDDGPLAGVAALNGGLE